MWKCPPRTSCCIYLNEFCMAKLNFQGKMKRNCYKSWGSMHAWLHASNFEMQHLMFECFLMIWLRRILLWLKQNELIFSRSQRKSKNSDQLRIKSAHEQSPRAWTLCVNPANFHAPIYVSYPIRAFFSKPLNKTNMMVVQE